MGEESASRFGRLFSSGGILFAGMVANLGLGFLTRLVAARVLGRVDYGAVTIGYTLLTVATILALAGTDTGVGRYLPRLDSDTRRRGVLSSAFHVALPLSLAMATLLFAFAGPLASHGFGDPDLTPVVRVFAIGVPFAVVVRLTVGSVRGMQESLPRVYIRNLGLPIARFLLVVVVLFVAAGAIDGTIGVGWAYVGGYVVAALLGLHYLVTHTPLFDGENATYMHAELLAFSAPLMITETMTMAFHNLDTLLLGYFATTGVVGVYNVVYPLSQLMTAVLTSFGFLFMPIFSSLESDGDHEAMARTYQVVSKWILLATLPTFLVLASTPETVIAITFGTEYRSGSLALAVLAGGFFTHAVAGPSGNALVAIGRSRTIMVDNTVVAVTNLALNVVLIPRLGLLGAALATTAGFLLMNGLYLVQLYRSTGIHPFTTASVQPCLAGIATWSVAWVGASRLLSPIPALLATGLAFGILYPLVIVRFGGVETEDLELVAAAESRIGVDLDPVRTYARRVVD